ncbi:MAG: hydrogenase expression/formation protein HypE [candidate division WOR-3 bacterium]
MKDSFTGSGGGEVYPPAFVGKKTEERIVLAHGAGGRKMHRLINRIFLKHFGNPVLNRLEDSAVVRLRSGQVCFTTDSYVVQPIFFPGGDIGKLAVCGTVNDLAVCGARPEYLSVSFVLREGLGIDILERLCRSIARTARRAGVQIVTGDTKVIEAGGSARGEIYINTSGVGVRSSVRLGRERAKPGDVIIINGGLGEHEASVAIARGDYHLKAKLRSDCAPLNRMIAAVLNCGGVKLMRDPTRGGLATTLNEFAEGTGLGLVIDEERLPVVSGVRAVAELLGLDPLYMANEGKVVIIADRRRAQAIIRVLRRYPEGRGAVIIGEVVKAPAGVWLRTRLGSLRRLLMLEGEQLPRIC